MIPYQASMISVAKYSNIFSFSRDRQPLNSKLWLSKQMTYSIQVNKSYVEEVSHSSLSNIDVFSVCHMQPLRVPKIPVSIY